MIILTVEEIIEAHNRLIQKTGGLKGIRDRTLLESAVLNIMSSFDGTELYPTIEEKAARLAYSLVKNHSFLDGNKRIGMLAMLLTLNLNHIKLHYFQKELIPSVDKGTHAPSTVFWRLAALTSIGVRPVRLIPLPCQPPKYGTWGPKEFCATDL